MAWRTAGLENGARTVIRPKTAQHPLRSLRIYNRHPQINLGDVRTSSSPGGACEITRAFLWRVWTQAMHHKRFHFPARKTHGADERSRWENPFTSSSVCLLSCALLINFMSRHFYFLTIGERYVRALADDNEIMSCVHKSFVFGLVFTASGCCIGNNRC